MTRIILTIFFVNLFSYSESCADESVDLSLVLRCDFVYCPGGQQESSVVESQAGFEIPKEFQGVTLQRRVISVSIDGNTLIPSSGPQIQNLGDSQVSPSNTTVTNQPKNSFTTASVSQNKNSFNQRDMVVEHFSNQPIYRDIRGPNGEEPSTVYVPVDNNGEYSSSQPLLNKDLRDRPINDIEIKNKEEKLPSATQTFPNMNNYVGYQEQYISSKIPITGNNDSGILAALANKLGNSFFNIFSQKKNNGSNKSKNLHYSAKKRGRGRIQSGPKWDKNALLRRYNKYKRGIASHLELGASNISLFKKICNQYADYAEDHRLPKNNSNCEFTP